MGFSLWVQVLQSWKLFAVCIPAMFVAQKLCCCFYGPPSLKTNSANTLVNVILSTKIYIQGQKDKELEVKKTETGVQDVLNNKKARLLPEVQ